MRKIQFAILIFPTLLVMNVGCRQTTGPSTAGPVGPLAPISPGQSPILGPFGGPTRVSPPPTGTFNSPNNYSGPVAPTGYLGAANSMPATPNQSFSNNEIVGSGVQVANWTETQADQPHGSLPGSSIGQSNFVTNDMRDPRAGGMQVIDLTGPPNTPGYGPPNTPGYGPPNTPGYGPPNTPGYRPPAAIYAPNALPTQPASAWQSSESANTTPSYPSPGMAPLYPSAAMAPIQQDYGVAAPSLLPAPNPTPRFPVDQYPVNQITRRPSSPISNNGSSVPSTEPNQLAPEGQLPWRRPGTQF